MGFIHKRYFALDTSGVYYPGIPLVQLFASILDKLPERANGKNKKHKAHGGEPLRANISILLADDDSDDREFFVDIITEIDPVIKVEMAESGEKLMQMLTSKKATLPDILFLDLNMPGKDGKQCLKEIKSNPGLKHLPVIIYSTSALSQDITDTQLQGANLYVKKPNSFNGAISLIKKVFSMDLEKMHPHQDIKNFVLLS